MNTFIGIVIGIIVATTLLLLYGRHLHRKKIGYGDDVKDFDEKDIKFLLDLLKEINLVPSYKDSYLLLSTIREVKTKAHLYSLCKSLYKDLKPHIESDEGYAVLKKIMNYNIEYKLAHIADQVIKEKEAEK